MTIQRKIPMRNTVIATLGYHIMTKPQLLKILKENYSKQHWFNEYRLDQFISKLSKEGLIEYKNVDNRYFIQLSDRGIKEYQIIRESVRNQILH